MEPTSTITTTSTTTPNFRYQRPRPDSLKIELLTIPEEISLTGFGHNFDNLLNISFENLTYTVQEGIFRRRPKTILHQINGTFTAGELTAVMGPSGCGKSTLMNILAGYTKTGVQGKILINDELRDDNIFLKQSCYIMQNDDLQPLLTVQEAMVVAANLKLSSKHSRKEKLDRVKEILLSLGLWEHRKIKTGKLSGGQKKRLSIALELLKNPQVMLFDEPTSGLDSLTSKQCIALLKQIASTGCTVICTIHQPSAIIFEMFDHLYALSNGFCIYQGSIKGLIPYLEESNLRCPPYHNPADYLLEIASGEYGDHTEILVRKSQNGTNEEWRKRQRNSLQLQAMEHIDNLVQNGCISPVKAPARRMTKNYIENERLKAEWYYFTGKYPTSYCNQILILIKRTFLLITRDPTLTYSRFATHLAIALFIGILYHGIGKDASNVLNNFNFMFFTVMFLMLTAFNCITTTFPSELPIITREHFNKWYSLKSYYLAITLADVPIQILATLLYALVTYFFTMQPIETFRILSFIFMCILISMVAQSFGLFIGATMDIKNAVIFGPFCFLPFTIFSGFFVQFNNAHPYMRWIFHISFLKYGFEGLVLSVLGYNRGKLPCNDADYCHFIYPEKFLDEMDMKYAEYSTAVIFLLSLIVIIRIAAYYALSLQIRRRR